MRTTIVLLLAVALVGCGKNEPGSTGAQTSAPRAADVSSYGRGPTGGHGSDLEIEDVRMQDELDLSKFGVTAYPGARPAGGSSFSQADIVTSDGAGGLAMFLTDDSPHEVLDFYEKELHDATRMGLGAGGSVAGTNASGDPVVISAAPDEGATRVSISLRAGRR